MVVGVDGVLPWLLLLWLLVQLLLVGGFEVDRRVTGPALVGEGVIGGSSPSSRALMGGVFMTLLMKTSGFNLRSSSSSISSLPPPPNSPGDIRLPRHIRLASGVEKLRPSRPFVDAADDDEGANVRDEGGTLDDPAAALWLEGGGDRRHGAVLPTVPGSVLMRTLPSPFRVSVPDGVVVVMATVPLVLLLL